MPNHFLFRVSSALTALLFSSVLLAAVPVSDPVSDRVGSTAGVFRVDESGQVSYSVALAVAPGTAGVTPEMALSYSSQGGDGVMGRGWSIAGLSSIGRCRKTREAGDFLQAADPVNTSGEPITFSREDVFCLDGQRLLAVTGVYGAAGTEYRLELDPFTRVFSRGGNNNADTQTYLGPAYFEVQRRDGSTSSYGLRDDARQRRNECGASACAYQSWALSRYEDSSGNYIDYDYQKLLSGSVVTGDVPSDEVLLQAVRYTGKRAINGVGSNSSPYSRLLFNYSVLPAGQQSGGWQSGSKVAQTRQLDSVSVQESILSTAVTIRHYVLSYAVSPARHQARLLQSIRECSNETQSVCYRPTTFDWLGDTAAATQTGGTANTTHLAGPKAGLRLGDVDGDGRQDMVWVDRSADGCSNGGFMVAYGAHTISNDTAWPSLSMPIQKAVCSPRTLSELEDSWHLIDYNGDGRDDLMFAGTTQQNRWFIHAARARPTDASVSAFETTVNLLQSVNIPVPSDSLRHAQLADFNADGVMDVVYPKTSGDSGFNDLYVRYMQPNHGGFGAEQLVQLNFNAEDVCGDAGDNAPPPGYFFSTCNYTFRPSSASLMPTDFNGDGRVDVMLRVGRYYEPFNRNGVDTPISGGYVSPEEMDAVLARAGDGTNGAVGIYDAHWYLFTTGAPQADGSVPLRQYAELDAVESASGNPFPQGEVNGRVQVADLNGDGLNDLLYGSPNAVSHGLRGRINTGKGFQAAVNTPSLGSTVSLDRVQIFDFTGDGRADILYPPDDVPSNPTCGAQSVSNQTLEFCLIHTQATPAGLSFTPTVRLENYPASDDGNLGSHDQLFGDFDGDGKVDYLRLARDTSPNHEILIVRDAQPHQPVTVIDGITDGMGAQTWVDYQPLTNASVYRRDPGVETPDWGRGSTVQEFLGPMYVVSQALSSTPTYANPEAVATIEYRYGGARIQAGGRGFLGFRFIDTLDINPDTSGHGSTTQRGVARTEYRQDYPFIGQPKTSLSLAVPSNYDFYSGLPADCRNSPEPPSDSACFAAFDVGWADINSGGAIKLSEKLNLWACKGHGNGSICPIEPDSFEDTCAEVSRAVSFVPSVSQQPIETYLIASMDLSYALNSTGSSGALLSAQMGVFCHEDSDGNVTFTRTETRVPNEDNVLEVLKAEETRNSYEMRAENDPKWQLGRLVSSEVKRAQGEYQHDINPVTRNVTFSYDLGNDGLLRTETPLAGSDGAESVRTLYDLDAYGNRTVAYVCSSKRADGSVLSDAMCRNRSLIQHRPVAADGRPTTAVHRYSRQEWDSLGRYPTISYAPFFTPSGTQVIERATTRVFSRDRLGNVTEQGDANGRRQRSGYGALGRAYYSEVDGGGSVSTTLRWCAGMPDVPAADTVACPVRAVYRTAVVSAGAPTRWSYHDRLGRAMLTVAEHFDGEAQPSNQRFSAACAFVDIKGRSERASEPFFLSQPASKDGSPAFAVGDNPCNLPDSQWSRNDYDLLSRPTKVTAPDGSQTLWRYSGLSTQQTNALGQLSESTRNALGQVISERQANPDNGAALGLTVSYEYDLQGSLRFTRRNAGRGEIVVEQRYDSHGRLVKLLDPDRGVEDYVYNAAGELIRAVDGSNQEILQHFDALGRRWKRVSGSPQVTDVWQYDTASKGVGALEVETRSSADEATWSRTYSFDAYGRPLSVATLLDGQTYTESSTYDDVGRPRTQTDASGKTLEQTYTIKGYPEALRDRYSRAGAYNRVRQMNARGQVTLERRGDSDNLAIRRSFDPQRGWLTDIQSGSGNSLQNLGYLYNAIGRLEWREDRRIAHREDFTYDALNRLKTVQLRLNNGSPITTLSLTYDVLGNLCSKNGVAYAYNGLDNCNATGQNASASPHAVSSIGGRAHLYDAAGRMSFAAGSSSSTDRSYDYSGLGELRAARVGGVAPSAELQLRYNPEGERIKEVQIVGGQTTTTRWVGNVEFIQVSTGSSTQVRRHIGGVAIESWFDSKPATVHYLFTDALGSVDTVANASGGIVERMSFDAHGNRRLSSDWQSPLGSIPTSTRQGFTGHHMLDVFGLIHMNGRVYDPQIGRFLQADVLLDAGIQGLNRYSYVLNNPLSLTDPSGHMSVGQILRTVAAIAITVYSGGTAAGAAWGFWGTSVTAGQALFAVAAGGFASGAIQSSSLKGGLTGAYTALAFYGVGSYFKAAEWASKGGKLTTIGRTAKIVAHGVVGGVSSELQGASFGSGFASAGFSEMAGPLTENLDSDLAQVAASALVGGTASRLSGGKFANGAVTAAMSWAFNELVHGGMSRSGERDHPEPDWPEDLASDIDKAYAILDRPPGSDGAKSLSLDEMHFIMETNARMLDYRSAAVGGYANISPEEFAKVLWGTDAVGDSTFYGAEGGTYFRISGAPGGLATPQIGGNINYFYQGMLHAARGNHFSAAFDSVVTYNLAFKGTTNIPDRLRWTAYGYDFYNKRGR